MTNYQSLALFWKWAGISVGRKKLKCLVWNSNQLLQDNSLKHQKILFFKHEISNMLCNCIKEQVSLELPQI